MLSYACTHALGHVKSINTLHSHICISVSLLLVLLFHWHIGTSLRTETEITFVLIQALLIHISFYCIAIEMWCSAFDTNCSVIIKRQQTKHGIESLCRLLR